MDIGYIRWLDLSLSETVWQIIEARYRYIPDDIGGTTPGGEFIAVMFTSLLVGAIALLLFGLCYCWVRENVFHIRVIPNKPAPVSASQGNIRHNVFMASLLLMPLLFGQLIVGSVWRDADYFGLAAGAKSAWKYATREPKRYNITMPRPDREALRPSDSLSAERARLPALRSGCVAPEPWDLQVGSVERTWPRRVYAHETARRKAAHCEAVRALKEYCPSCVAGGKVVEPDLPTAQGFHWCTTTDLGGYAGYLCRD